MSKSVYVIQDVIFEEWKPWSWNKFEENNKIHTGSFIVVDGYEREERKNIEGETSPSSQDTTLSSKDQSTDSGSDVNDA